MKKLFVLSILFLLVACGAIGIGSNHETMVYNNSNDIITVSADSGVYKIKPEDNLLIYSNNDLTIKNLNSDCQEKKVLQKLNTGAVILDVFPGFILGIIPILVDAVSNNIYKMPKAYSYSCL